MLFQKPSRKIDFLVIGAQKSGTSELHYQLKQHPTVGVGQSKELHFFDNEKVFKGDRSASYSSLHSKFNFDSDEEVYGETTPIYLN